MALTVALLGGAGGLRTGGCSRRRARQPGAVSETLGSDGTTINVGNPHAPVTVHLYEDPRCPVCEEFESTGGGPELVEVTVRGEVRTQYTMASFPDARLNALRAALAEGRFAEYHEVLYAHQPEESEDGFTDERLLELAMQVEGLKGRTFETAVRDMTYEAFVKASEKAYESVGDTPHKGPGTPTAVINKVRIPADCSGVLYDATTFSNVLELIRRSPEEWEGYEFPEVQTPPSLS